MTLVLDEIGYWSEIKLDILSEYASAYSRILNAKKGLSYIYIDGFAGAGIHISRSSSELVPGSPSLALKVDPPFHEYHFIDLDGERAENLRKIAGTRKNVFVYEGDCNKILLEQVFPRVRWEDYRRALCIIDPYGLHLNWEVMKKAGTMKTMDIFLNFPVADINRNILWLNPARVDSRDIERMNRFWGDGSWRDIAYKSTPTLFGDEELIKQDTKIVVEAFRKRLKTIGGFEYVPEPMPMVNKKGAVVYYLFFASQKAVAQDIIRYIFNKYRKYLK